MRMGALFFKKNDMVLVIKGKDRGKRGKVLRVNVKRERAIVEKVNMVKRHTRANPQKNIKGGIVEHEAALSVSNLMVVCPECGEPTRVGHIFLDDGKKVRVCKKCQGVLDR
jgi:large subunit ribosomal protein L24